MTDVRYLEEAGQHGEQYTRADEQNKPYFDPDETIDGAVDFGDLCEKSFHGK